MPADWLYEAQEQAHRTQNDDHVALSIGNNNNIIAIDQDYPEIQPSHSDSKGEGRAKSPLTLQQLQPHRSTSSSNNNISPTSGPPTPSTSRSAGTSQFAAGLANGYPQTPPGGRSYHHHYSSAVAATSTKASLWQRAKEYIMVASPRLPFYSGIVDDSGFARSSTMARSLTPTRASHSQHERNSSQPAISFTGPAGLFSPNPNGTPNLFASAAAGLGITNTGFMSPRPGHANSPSAKFTPGSRRPLLYKEKSDDDFFKSPRPEAAMRRTASTPGKASFFRLPRSILRLISRRSRTFPLLMLLMVLTFWALGYTRRGSMGFASMPMATSRISRFLQAAVPGTDLQMRDLNPMKWANIRSGYLQKPFEAPTYDVLSHDPAGPSAKPGSVGSAAHRYASWEGGRSDGRMLVKEGEPHPIPMLMQRAKQRWHALKNRQSRTFAEAVAEYERRYGRMPPRGFDRWYAFAKYHDVQLIDEFNIIEDDFRMFRAFSGPSFRARVAKLENSTDFAWNIKVHSGKAFADGELRGHDRAKGVLHLIRKFAHELPDLHIVYNGHDIARQNTGWEERERLDALVDAGAYDHFNASDSEMRPIMASVAPGWGMPTICPPESAVRAEGFDYGFANREWTGMEQTPIPEGAAGTVIDSFYKYMDVCDSPQYRHTHSSSSYVFPWHPTPTLPLFTAGVHSHFSDIHCIITEQFGMEGRYDPTWEERPFSQLIFKGQSSGPFYDKNSAWKSSHRARLHLLSHNEEGTRNITITDENDIVSIAEVPNFQLNPMFLDTGIVGPPVQCHKEDGTCDEMARVFNGFDPRVTFEKASLYKYVGDFDGNSWSGRFSRLMASNAAVVKATLYREFWTDWAVPWLHFIPVQVDYSDLWDVLAFFRGGPKGEGAHDDLGKEIAVAGKDWARNYFRYEDMEAFTFRQYLEYARLFADDREEMTYSGEVEGYEPVWIPKEEEKQ